MFGKKNQRIMVVHDDAIFWLAGRGEERGRCVLRLPLQALLDDDGVAERIPKSLKGNYRWLCIVPDHWFGIESFPFRSRNAALIDSFLERKLAASYPELKELRHFITYRHAAVVGEGEGVNAYFLQDPKSFQLYSALRKLSLCPRRITAPAFLWMEKLAQTIPEFDRHGTLLIHMNGRECLLYFYFNGNYLFSRNVILSEAQDRMEALAFEINQSLYMFSQKTKSELSRFYFLGDASAGFDAFSQTLGREVTDIGPLLDRKDAIGIDALPFLDGVLRHRDLALRASFLNVNHRQVRRELEWEPVQWAGICIGALLLFSLIGENLVLGRMLRTEEAASRSLHQQVQRSDGMGLADDDSTMERVLQAAERTQAHDAVYRLLASLPAGVRVKELELALEEPSAVTLQAFVSAGDADHLKSVLTQLASRIRRHFKNAQAFSINDIDIRMEASDDMHAVARYLISFRLDLV